MAKKKTAALAKVENTTGRAMEGAAQLAGMASLLVVSDAKSNLAGADLLVQLKQARTKVEDARGFLVQPLKAHIKAIEAKFKPTLDSLTAADTALRQRLLAYRREEENRIEAAKAAALGKALAAQKRGDTVKATALAVAAVNLTGPATQTLAAGGAVQAKKRWTFEVVEATKVPREYMEVDDTRVRAAIRAGVREVPGLRIFQTDELAVGVA